MSPHLSRRSLVSSLALVTGAALVSGCRNRRADGLTAVKLQADWYPQPEHGGFYTALVNGYYRSEGLDVAILPGGPYVASEGLVASGAVQFGLNSSDHVLEAAANAAEPLLAVGATMQHDPQGLMLHAESPVQTWADLDGRTVAVRPGSTWWEFIVKRFQLHHVREIPATYSVANFLQDPNYIQQAFVTSEPFFARKAGAATRMLLNRDAGYDPYRVFYTSQAFAQANPDVVSRFTRASIRGWRQYLADPTPANALIQKLNPALNAEWMKFSCDALKSGAFVAGDDPGGGMLGRFDPARWSNMYQQLLELKVLQNPIDPASVYTTKFLGDA